MRNWRHRSTSLGSRSLFAFVALAATAGCEGAGEGALDGTLFMRGCPTLDPTPAGSQAVPSPLPAFSLAPRYFFGEVAWSIQQGFSTADPRGVSMLRMRMQPYSGTPDHADEFELLIYDLENYQTRQDQAVARGEPGMPIVPPPVDSNNAPLPPDPASSVRASLSMNVTCWFPRVAPSLRGYVNFSSLGMNLGDEIAGQVSVTLEDSRATREQGDPPPAPDVAGQLTGWFRFPLRDGPLVP